MIVNNYADGLTESKLWVVEFRNKLLEDVNKVAIFWERLVFSREDEYIVWEDSDRVKFYFTIDHEDDLNGKYLKHIWDVKLVKRENFLKGIQTKIDNMGKCDWYGRPKISSDKIKEMCQWLFDMVKDLE